MYGNGVLTGMEKLITAKVHRVIPWGHLQGHAILPGAVVGAVVPIVAVQAFAAITTREPGGIILDSAWL